MGSGSVFTKRLGIAWCLWFLLAPAVLAAQEFLTLQDRIIEVFQQREGTVAKVKAAFSTEEGDGRRSLRVGSGFFVSANGHLLTNASVVEGAERIWIEHHQLSFPAKLIGADTRSNVALVQIKENGENFDFISLGSTEVPPIGTLLISIACALDFEPAPAMGLVSGHETQFGERVFPTLYLRTTLPANPGEGGAPVLDFAGRFAGMIVASLPEVRSSYVIPGRAVARIRDDLMAMGKVDYGWIGIEVEPRFANAEGRQLVIAEVSEGGPSERAGLRDGDVLLAMNGVRLSTLAQLRHDFFLIRSGEMVVFDVKRYDRVRRISVEVEKPQGLSNGL